MKKNRKVFFKVCRGYGDDYIIIPEDELARAIYAQVTGGIFMTASGTIAGNKIDMIVPDYVSSFGYRETDIPRWFVAEYGFHPKVLAETKFREAQQEARLMVEKDEQEMLEAGEERTVIGEGMRLLGKK